MSSHSSKMPSQRQLRVGEQLKHIIAETLQRGYFHHESPVDAGRITVTEVRPSPDLRNATAYVVIVGGGDMTSTLKALNENHAEFQREINKQSAMKFTPRVTFKEDEAFEKAGRIEDLLKDITYSEDNED